MNKKMENSWARRLKLAPYYLQYRRAWAKQIRGPSQKAFLSEPRSTILQIRCGSPLLRRVTRISCRPTFVFLQLRTTFVPPWDYAATNRYADRKCETMFRLWLLRFVHTTRNIGIVFYSCFVYTTCIVSIYHADVHLSRIYFTFFYLAYCGLKNFYVRFRIVFLKKWNTKNIQFCTFYTGVMS